MSRNRAGKRRSKHAKVAAKVVAQLDRANRQIDFLQGQLDFRFGTATELFTIQIVERDPSFHRGHGMACVEHEVVVRRFAKTRWGYQEDTHGEVRCLHRSGSDPGFDADSARLEFTRGMESAGEAIGVSLVQSLIARGQIERLRGLA